MEKKPGRKKKLHGKRRMDTPIRQFTFFPIEKWKR